MPSEPKIITTSHGKWCEFATDTISNEVKSFINAKNKCSMMLTGGYTAKQLYQHWAVSKPRDHRKIRYYFGDVLCVHPDHVESNYSMVRQTLFPHGILKGCTITRMEAERRNREMGIKNYEHMLPGSINILLLSVGQDGHIDSLFPGDQALLETTRSVVSIVAPKPPPERLTITTRVIQKAKSTFLFAQANKKVRILAEALEEPNEIVSLPVRLVIDATWVLDSEVTEQFNNYHCKIDGG